MVSLRTARLLGSLWADVDTLRVKRTDLVTSLMATCQEPEHAAMIDMRFGVGVVSTREDGTA